MSIYFEYPSINEFKNLVYPLNNDNTEMLNILNEDRFNKQHIEELKDFLTLKPV